ncbi:DUF3099 domain-containing protein [Yinghuangia sp. ASG 101]|uniref:DUF3099 domain-containing protein n=1 Tax=Yinghuangia sp. ASG 101 TaxID=2896848 RepID=UPI002F908FCD
MLVNRVRSAKAPVYRISGARKGLSEDIRGRQRRYVVSMSVRTVCFLLAVVISGPVRWVMLAAALFLPYIAVVIANAGRKPTSETPPPAVPPMAHRAIEPPPDAVLTHAERCDVHAMPEDAWIVPDDARDTAEDTADISDNPPGRRVPGDPSRPTDEPSEGNGK